MDFFESLTRLEMSKLISKYKFLIEERNLKKKTVMSIKSSMISDDDLKIQFFNFDMSPSMRCLVL